MKKIIGIGLVALILGCTSPPNPSVITMTPVISGPTQEDIEAKILAERHKSELAQFEKYVNDEAIQMMEFFSIEVGQLMVFKPLSYMMSDDNLMGIAKCEVYMAGNFVGLTYIVAGNDGTGWKFLTLVNKTVEPSKETP